MTRKISTAQLQEIADALRAGAFDPASEAGLAILGVLDGQIEAATEVERVLRDMAGLSTWDEKVIAKAEAEGVTDPDRLEEIVLDRGGDMDDDYLLERESELKDTILWAREMIELDPVVEAEGPEMAP